jgi:acetate---CoA ligase (ADP-forming)
MFRSVECLVRPKSIAIVGASETGGGGWAKSIYQNLAFAGFPAKTYLINPNRSELWGERVYSSFAELGTPIDLALTIIPSEGVPNALNEGVRHGLRCALVFASRFGEGGDPEGTARGAVVKALTESDSLRVSGPNCMGAINIHDRLLIYPSAKVRALPVGSVGVVFQSGGTFQFWLHQGAVRGLGFSYAISSGNELDLDLADYVNFLVEDERTTMICCMVEGIRRPAAFVVAAEKALAARKPILMVKIGSSAAGQAAARSHTGALAGDDRVFNAVCEKFGVVRCLSLDDMLETALAFSQNRYPTGSKAAMVIASGGAKGLFLDYAHEEGLEFGKITPETTREIATRIDQGVPAENPLDVGTGLAVRLDPFSEVCRIMCEDPNVDILAMHGMVPIEETDAHDPSAFARLRSLTNKPIVGFGRLGQNMSAVGREFQKACGIPFLQGMPEAVRAIKSLVKYSATLKRGILPITAPRGQAPDVSGDRLQELLVAYGIGVPRSALVKDIVKLEARSQNFGFPLVLKIKSPQASHKTEAGGVAVNLPDPTSVRNAAEGMVKRLRAIDLDSVIEGFLLQEVVSGTEIIVGVREDPQYGPLMLVGLGGVFVEALQDVCIRLLPIDETMARDMLSSLAGRALLGAFRGQPARDVSALAKAMAGLSRLFLDHRPWLVDLEINPLMVLCEGDGVRAVDVRAVNRDH